MPNHTSQINGAGLFYGERERTGHPKPLKQPMSSMRNCDCISDMLVHRSELRKPNDVSHYAQVCHARDQKALTALVNDGVSD